jgi:hypothetical protein
MSPRQTIAHCKITAKFGEGDVGVVSPGLLADSRPLG